MSRENLYGAVAEFVVHGGTRLTIDYGKCDYAVEMRAPDARVTAFRWHILDPVIFRSSLRFEIERKGFVMDARGEEVRTPGREEVQGILRPEARCHPRPLPPKRRRRLGSFRSGGEASGHPLRAGVGLDGAGRLRLQVRLPGAAVDGDFGIGAAAGASRG